MSSKKVSVFLVSHGSIDASFKRLRPDSETGDDEIYDFSIRCENLPENVRLCTPNILGKPYYENRVNMIKFIESKIMEWNSRPQPAAVPEPASNGRARSRSREPKKDSFSDFIAETLTTFEKDETAEMYDLMDKCEKADSRGYEKGHKMPIKEKQLRREMNKATMQKNGIKWVEIGCYIPEKHYNLTGEDVLVVIEEIDGRTGVRTVRKIVEPRGLIPGRMNLAQVNAKLRILLTPGDTDEICFFDFACSTFNFEDIPAIDQYWPNLLSCQLNGDGGATLIYGTIPKVRCKEMTTAEEVGQRGVNFGDDPYSQLTVNTQSSQGVDSQSSLAASTTPFLYVTVPIEAISTIDFGSVVFRAGPGPGGVAAGLGSHGGKRKYTKRKCNLKKSYRKRRVVTRRRYNTRRYTKMNR